MELTNETLQRLAEKTTHIAREAGNAVLEIYNKVDFGVEWKSDNSPLTRADKASNRIICDGLEAMEPQFPIISEENSDIPYETRKGFEYFWIVDPLDGTKEFIKRNGEFTINIALVKGNTPVIGVVYVPVTDTMYWAISGKGSYRKMNGKEQEVSVAGFSMQDDKLMVVCSRSHMNDETKAFVEQLKNPETVSKGSSLKFLVVAEGNAHLYPRIAPTMEWDTCAAQCILEAAGGQVLEYSTRKPLVYNKESLLNPHFLATGKVNG